MLLVQMQMSFCQFYLLNEDHLKKDQLCLRQQHSELLKKYAEARNTIDELQTTRKSTRDSLKSETAKNIVSESAGESFHRCRICDLAIISSSDTVSSSQSDQEEIILTRTSAMQGPIQWVQQSQRKKIV